MLQRNKNQTIINPLTNLKENTMFAYTEVEKKYKEFEAQVKQISDFWINAIISSLKQFTK